MPEKPDYKITDAPDRTREQEKQEELHIPAYNSQLKLSDEQLKRLSKEWKLEHDAIDKEWKAAGLIEKFDSLDNQYEGNLEQQEDRQFNVHKHTTKVKVDTATRYAKKAFLKSDPIFSISPRPEYSKEGGVDVCEQQQEYLDYKLDEGEIPFKSPLGKVLHSAGVKGAGILKVPHEIKREKCKREELYKGTPTYGVSLTNDLENPQVMEMDQETLDKYLKVKPEAKYQMVSNKGLDDFIASYPDAQEKYPGYVKKLVEGKEIRIVVEYEDITYNDPLPKYVVLQNFRCRLTCQGYEGMKTTKLLDEKMSYTWWELKQEEAAGKFFDIDKLKVEYGNDGEPKKKGDKDKEKEGYENEVYNVFESIFYFKVEEDDEEYTKIRFWIEEDSKKVIGVTLYPYYGVPCYYVPFYVYDKWEGWLQPGIAEYLTDTNIAEDAFLNFMLEALWANNLITPIVPEDSAADIQFLEKEWVHGLPIKAKAGEIDFLQKYMKPPDVGGLVMMMNILTRHGDDTSQISSYSTGRESPMDPDAPARKTLALLQQAGINIEEYIDNLLPSFNETGKIFLQLTYQMSKEGRKYRPKGRGGEFKEISRAAMIARTNIQSQAMAFNFDALEENKKDLALYQTVRSEPLIASNPQAVWIMLKQIIKNWSPKWRNNVDTILPTLEELQKSQLQICVKALAMYIQAKAQESEITGVKPEFEIAEIQKVMQQAMSELATPPSEEVQKERKEMAKKQGAQGA